jgi:hypothetical protein
MTDDIFSVATPFADVASLAQGYMNRADGERLLLPLPTACSQGGGLRFVVYLSDGTPAFAGAGLCAQISDQGNTVPKELRFETLLDTLQFDDRSRPVYDYIVAVRSAAYAQSKPQSVPAGSDTGEAVDGAELYEEPTSLLLTPPPEVAPSMQPDSWSNPSPADEAAEIAPAPVVDAASLVLAMESEGARAPSFVPAPIPTGLLTRPARATHWQPSPPRRPTPRPASGLFRYPAGALPRPARPPRPDLDPAQWVQPAARP